MEKYVDIITYFYFIILVPRNLLLWRIFSISIPYLERIMITRLLLWIALRMLS